MPQNNRLLKGAYASASPLGEEIPHNPGLVSIVEERRKLRRKSFFLVTPFAGKDFLKEYLRGIDQLPLAQAHFICYDNSNSNSHRAKLRSLIADRFDSYTLIGDRNPQFTVEKTDEYRLICHRAHCIYEHIYETVLPTLPRLPLALNVEDDIELPAEAWPRLNAALDIDPQGRIATAVGVARCRRLKDVVGGEVIAWNFVRQERIGGDFCTELADRELIPLKEAGIELIGSAHMGVWLTRTAVIRKIGMPVGLDGMWAHDMCWGYHLNRSGYRMAIDWSVRARHYFKDGKKTCFV